MRVDPLLGGGMKYFSSFSRLHSRRMGVDLC